MGEPEGAAGVGAQTKTETSDALLPIVWGSITRSRLSGLAGWDHRCVVISVVHLLVRWLLGCLTVLFQGRWGCGRGVAAGGRGQAALPARTSLYFDQDPGC